MKLSVTQRYWLATLAGDHIHGSTLVMLEKNGTYNPLLREQRTFDSLERLGLAEWYSGANHGSYNGYRITDAGLVAYRATLPTTQGKTI